MGEYTFNSEESEQKSHGISVESGGGVAAIMFWT
jgi:hypothetical protein